MKHLVEAFSPRYTILNMTRDILVCASRNLGNLLVLGVLQPVRNNT